MPLFAGLDRTDYQDLLRAVGRLLDSEGLRNFRLIEQEDGLILQVLRSGLLLQGFETYLLTREDLHGLLHQVYQLRGQGKQQELPRLSRSAVADQRREAVPPPLVAGLAQATYQDVLRAVGRLLDGEELRGVRLLEQEDGLILQALRTRRTLRSFETYRLTADDVRRLVDDAAWRPAAESPVVPRSA